MDKSLLWANILAKIKREINSLSYQTWFEDTTLYELKNGIAKIIVPYAAHKNHLTNNYKELLKTCFINEIGEQVELEFLLEEEVQKDNITDTNQQTSSENKIGNNTNHESFLNKKYTFDNFIVGNSNKFAQAAALAVAQKPGETYTYNPLFIYGNSGLGKTHLMHAIGNYIEEHSNKKVLYVTSETFVTEFVEITKKQDNKNNFEYIDYFKQKYRNIDVLIIDDIQFLAGATESQKEFFHTFNNLYGDNKQIIISSDRSPNDLKIFEDRLRTRFSWGLPVNIYPPDFELKVAILKKKIIGEQLTTQIPEEVIEYMASNIGTDIRQLEGSVNRLMAYSTMMCQNIDLNLAVEALKDYINKGYSEKNDISRVQKIVADYFKISIEDLKSKKRNADIAFPRQIAMYLCRKLVGESYPKIGIEFGGKDHSTVMHSCEKIEIEIKNNKSFRETIEKLESDIQSK